jgi:DNA polymerase IV
MNKPDGLTVISGEDAPGIIAALPTEDFYGVGPRTAAKLKTLGINNGADLKQHSLEELKKTFGKVGEGFYHLARAEDPRPVESNREAKRIKATGRTSRSTFSQSQARGQDGDAENQVRQF